MIQKFTASETTMLKKIHRCALVGLPLVLGLLLLLFPARLFPQFYNGSNMTFGKNRVQYNNSIWSFYKFEEFDTYFYLNGKELALYTAWYTDQQLPTLERKLETVLDDKIQFIIFNNLNDLKQSNIGLSGDQQYNTGGITHILGNKVVLYGDGDLRSLERQIRAGIADILINQLIFGGSIGSQIRNAALFTLPDWYRNGLISYLSEDWSTSNDNRLRDGMLSGRFKKINRLEGEDAIIAGHSLWRFIEIRYGPSAITNILHLTQLTRNVQNGFLYVTGLTFKQLTAEWYQYYYESYASIPVVDAGKALPYPYRDDLTYSRPMASPDDSKVAYITNREGRLIIWLEDGSTGNRKKIYKSGFSSALKTDHSYPILAWHPSGEILAAVVEEKGSLWLYFFNLTENTREKRIIFDFQKITSFSYSPDGQLLAMSAVRQGKPDIYVYSIASNSHIQLTNDFYTDMHPVFFDGIRQIVFSSNRDSDTLKAQAEPEIQRTTFDLFSYDFAKKSPVLKRITESAVSDEKQPMHTKHGTIHYLSDVNGYNNLFQAVYDSAISYVDTTVHYRYFFKSSRLTGFTRPVHDYTLLKGGEEIWFTSLENNRIRMYKAPTGNIPSEVFSSFMKQKMANAPKDEVNREEEQKIQVQYRKRFANVYRNSPQIVDSMEINETMRQGGFAIDGSKRRGFESLTQRDEKPKSVFGRAEPKRRIYNVEFYYDQLFTQVDFTYINYSYQPFSGGGSPIYLNPGFNVFLGVELSDLLEDYRLGGGVRLNSNLQNNEYVAMFSNLRKRLDRHIIFHRQSIDLSASNFLARTQSHELFYMLSWPFSEAMSLRATGIYRNDMLVFLATDQTSLKRPNIYENWAGLRTEFVFDNSRDLGMNLYSGIRSKAFAEYYQLVSDQSRNLVVLGIDFRHYQKIHRNFIWANRFAASTSFGNNRLIYYMGGVDNWLIPSFNRSTPIDFGQDYAYQTLATNMRGFNQNIRNGNSFAVINSELRLPVFRYFLQRPINSDFIRHFQLVAFGDLGTAWTGINPYDPSNSLYTNTITNGPLTITVEVQKEPIVGGMGLGARTMLLGYFLRADMAWGVEDMRITKPIFYLSFSLDF
jgi:hypothetical protein